MQCSQIRQKHNSITLSGLKVKGIFRLFATLCNPVAESYQFLQKLTTSMLFP